MAKAPILSAGTRGPRWRALLEARWQARLEEVTELSLANHGAAAGDPDGHGDGQQQIQRLLRRTVAARRKLTDVGRPTAGNFGISPFVHLPITASLAVIIVVMGGAVAVSLWRDRAARHQADRHHGPVHG
jgi:hypothetical protein